MQRKTTIPSDSGLPHISIKSTSGVEAQHFDDATSKHSKRGNAFALDCPAQPPFFGCLPALLLFFVLFSIYRLDQTGSIHAPSFRMPASLGPVEVEVEVGVGVGAGVGVGDANVSKTERVGVAEEGKSSFRLVAVGDILILTRYMREAESYGNFSHIWEPVRPLLEAADVACGNFEGGSSNVSAWSKNRARGKPQGELLEQVFTHDKVLGFNYPPDFAKDLVQVGFKVLSVANNHCMDRGIEGLKQTVRRLRSAGIVPTGGRAESRGPNDMQGFVQFTRVKEWNVAWLSCTTFANAIMQKRYKTTWQEVARHVLDCDRSITMIETLHKRSDVDVVLVQVHHGPEWNPKHAAGMQNRCVSMLEAGATVVLSGHSHVVQDATPYTTSDGRKTYISYSLGSFSAGMGFTPGNRIINYASRASAMMYVTIGEGVNKHGETSAQVEDVSYVPTCEWFTPDSGVRVYATSQLDGNCAKEQRIVAKALGADKRFITPKDVLGNRYG